MHRSKRHLCTLPQKKTTFAFGFHAEHAGFACQHKRKRKTLRLRVQCQRCFTRCHSGFCHIPSCIQWRNFNQTFCIMFQGERKQVNPTKDLGLHSVCHVDTRTFNTFHAKRRTQRFYAFYALNVMRWFCFAGGENATESCHGLYRLSCRTSDQMWFFAISSSAVENFILT